MIHHLISCLDDTSLDKLPYFLHSTPHTHKFTMIYIVFKIRDST